ncbi:MAG: lipopolysaccharide kinase InaA family protein [Acidobacteriota bacterium]
MSRGFDLGDLDGEIADGLELPTLEATVRRLIDPANAVRTLHWGRNYLYTIELDSAAGPVHAVVKQFRHQGWRERWRRRVRGSKAMRSWRAAYAVREAGVLTPAPLLLVESKDPAGPAWYVSAAIDRALELRYFLRALNAGTERSDYPAIDGEKLVSAVGRLARRLHEASIWHRDLTGGNLLAPWDEGAIAETAGDPALFLLDLNRARLGKRLSTSERMRDLARFPVLRAADQERFLAGYFGEPSARHRVSRALYGWYHRGFLWKNRVKPKLRGGMKWLRDLVVPRSAHAHIPAAPDGAAARDRSVWDALSDQPHQHASRWQKLGVRVADLPAHAQALANAGFVAPRIWRRYRALKRQLYSQPVGFDGLGVCVRPWPANPEALLQALDDLGARKVLLRLHPWEADHSSEEDLARTLHGRGYELAFALPQNRDLVRDPARWRRSVEELAERFIPFGKHFQIGQAINRSKWGVWTLREYAALAASAAEVLRRYPGVEILGPGVIDFEYHQTAAALNLGGAGYRFDAVSALLYVDRRGAPENRQMTLDTVDKVVLLQAIAETAKNSAGRTWITEVNWPLWEGPHSPAGRSVSVDEETQANYLVRYYLEALGTGCVERVYWWQVVARGYGLIAPETGGLRRRPAYRALATLVKMLSGSSFLGPLPSPAGTWMYRFRDSAGGELLVCWCLEGRTPVDLPGSVTATIDRDGTPFDRGGARLQLSPSPIYLRLAP